MTTAISDQRSAVSRRLRGKLAFTLVELLTVIAIIGILAGLIVGASKYAVTKSKRSSAAGRIAALEAALEDYKADNGGYPPQIFSAGAGRTKALYAALSPTSGKRYFTAFTSKENISDEIFDPFGNEYYYVSPGKVNTATFDLYSAGPDGQPNTPDDITNWQANN